MSKTLKERLPEWVDYSSACYELGCVLGLFDEQRHPFRVTKHVLEARHEVGDHLYDLLYSFVDLGILEIRDDSEVRWNANYRGSWDQRSIN